MGTRQQSKQQFKRIGILVTPAQYEELQKRREALRISLSNMIRRALMLPEEEHGARKDLLKKNIDDPSLSS